MQCELCNQENPVSCDHGKNGYCLLFNQQAEKDKSMFGPKNMKTLADLEIGETFRYKNSDPDDWHTVSGKDEAKIYYSGGNTEQSNFRVENVEVIVK